MKGVYKALLLTAVFSISTSLIAGVIENKSIQETKKRVITYKPSANTTFYKTMAYDVRNQMLIDGETYTEGQVKKINSGVSVNSNYVNAASGSTVVLIQNNSGDTVAIGK